MRVRESIIIEESILKQIDEIAGQKQRRAAIIEKALTEFIEREARKTKAVPAVASERTSSPKR
jgi:predicted transcriptional regulator